MPIYRTADELGAMKHDITTQFECCICKDVQYTVIGGRRTSNYCYSLDRLAMCYACAGKKERDDMAGAFKWTLYLTQEIISGIQVWVVSNWPGTFKVATLFPVRHGRHNMARKRRDCWFLLDGRKWHGVNYGDHSQLLHCKRVLLSPNEKQAKALGWRLDTPDEIIRDYLEERRTS